MTDLPPGGDIHRDGGIMKYAITYWLPNQSRQFSEPQHTTVRMDMLELCIHTAIQNGYQIESIVRVDD